MLIIITHLFTNNLTKGESCVKKLTTEDVINRSNIKHGYKYSYKKTQFINTRTKIIVTCPVDGDFEQLPLHHINGQGCPKCSGKKKYTLKEFIDKANVVHNYKYNYILVNLINTSTKIKIICPIHGEFYQRPYCHLTGDGCPSCYGNKKLTHIDFIVIANNIHNNKYKYPYNDYINNKTKIRIECSIHGIFLQTPNAHISGSGCPNCKKEFLSKLKTYDTKQFIEIANSIHNKKYTYLKTIYINSKEVVTITCPDHGDFEQTARDHLQGAGCPKCGKERISNALKHNITIFIEKAFFIHGNRYDYSQSEYINSKTKLKIKCQIHGYFYQTPGNHLNGAGCPRCSESKGEKIISSILNKHNIKYIREYKIPNTEYKLRYDFYLPDYNLLIEFQGIQHYEPVQTFGGEDAFKQLQFRDNFKKGLTELVKLKILYFNYKQLKLSNKEFEILVIKTIDSVKGKKP